MHERSNNAEEELRKDRQIRRKRQKPKKTVVGHQGLRWCYVQWGICFTITVLDDF